MEQNDFIFGLLDETKRHFLEAAMSKNYDEARKSVKEMFNTDITSDQYNKLREALGLNNNGR